MIAKRLFLNHSPSEWFSFIQKASGICQTFGRIVIAADNHCAGAAQGQHAQKLIQQFHRVGSRIGAIINIARNQHGIRAFIVQQIENPVQN